MLALTCDIELFTDSHYRESIDGDASVSPLWRDLFLYHWQEECQHAKLDELEWLREDRRLTNAQRDRAIDDLIALVAAVDIVLRAQSAADGRYFATICGRIVGKSELQSLRSSLLAAYRWQYICSGVQHPHFAELLGGMTTAAQQQRITAALAPMLAS